MKKEVRKGIREQGRLIREKVEELRREFSAKMGK